MNLSTYLYLSIYLSVHFFIYLYLFIYPFVYLSIYLHLFIHPYIYIYIDLSFYTYLSIFLHLSIYLSAGLGVHLADSREHAADVDRGEVLERRDGHVGRGQLVRRVRPQRRHALRLWSAICLDGR